MTGKVYSPRRTWISRMESKSLLKVLILINVFLAMYLVLWMNSGVFTNTPCVVIMNTTNSNIVVRSQLEEKVSYHVLLS